MIILKKSSFTKGGDFLNNKIVIAVVVVLVLVVGGFIFMNRQSTVKNALDVSNPEMASSTPSDSARDSAQSAVGDNSQVKEFTVSNSGFSFNPATLTVNQGDKVKITFKNTGGSHDLTIDGFNVSTKVIQSGQQDSIEFTADKAGTFEYYCSVGNHRALGMKGTLVVQ